MTSGVYKITNTLTGKCYIGATNNIALRFAQHRRQLNNGTHHCKPLQEEWSFYGQEAFDFCVLQELEKEELYVTEKYYIKEYTDLGECYNKYEGRYNKSPEAIQYDAKIKVSMSLTLRRAIQTEADKQGIRKAELVRRAIIQYLGLPSSSPDPKKVVTR